MTLSKKINILDCTLRDGGYYTKWDFSNQIISSYIDAMNRLPVDYIEVGYRNLPSGEYMGKMGYCPVSVLETIRQQSQKKVAVMLNEKSTRPEDLEFLLKPITGLVDMVRIAIDPQNFERAVVLAQAVKSYGFEVGINVMYMSTWLDNDTFLNSLSSINDIADLFCMVDSYGGVSPREVKDLINIIKTKTICPIGFHGHNNLQLGLINTLTAIECGVDYVDVTVLGMGRGAGNLNLELLLTYLNKDELSVDFNVLGDVITAFIPLFETYKWGTQLPYMISGANSIPQKEVMELVTNRIYSFDSVVRGLQNRKNKVEDNAKYPILDFAKYDDILIIGGGQSPIEHYEGIVSFIQSRKSIALVFATARHAALFKNVIVPKYYCLVGREAQRLAQNVEKERFDGKCVLPPYPRKLGTDVPNFAKKQTYELEKISFPEQYKDSCTAIAFQLALQQVKDNIYIVGYDGYPNNVLSEKEMALTNENRALLTAIQTIRGENVISLTPTLYPEMEIKSLYQYI